MTGTNWLGRLMGRALLAVVVVGGCGAGAATPVPTAAAPATVAPSAPPPSASVPVASVPVASVPRAAPALVKGPLAAGTYEVSTFAKAFKVTVSDGFLLRESDDVDPFLRPGGALEGPLRDDLSAILSGQVATPAPSEGNRTVSAGAGKLTLTASSLTVRTSMSV